MNDMMNPRRCRDRNSRRSKDKELGNQFFEGDCSSSNEWGDYSVAGDDYEGAQVFDDDYEEASVFDDDQFEEESMPVYDTDIEDVIEEEEGFVGKGGFGKEEENMNTIKLPVGNNVVPLRPDTIRLVQNGCLFHGLWSEDLNQHLKDFLKLVDSIDLDGENRERTRLHLFQFSLRDQASNWLERLSTGSITHMEDLNTREISIQKHGRRFKDLQHKVPHHSIRPCALMSQSLLTTCNPVTRRTSDQSVGGKLRDKNAKESWALLEDLALYDNES
ncbi:hypothetical protein Tco_0725833 [Tanacetum coccineum]|uniref:MAK10-like protein n=1 Tax=Tanacetum coccineum TaxID=301880 RepID=A0ABQ4YG79_9ASTR